MSVRTTENSRQHQAQHGGSRSPGPPAARPRTAGARETRVQAAAAVPRSCRPSGLAAQEARHQLRAWAWRCFQGMANWPWFAMSAVAQARARIGRHRLVRGRAPAFAVHQCLRPAPCVSTIRAAFDAQHMAHHVPSVQVGIFIVPVAGRCPGGACCAGTRSRRSAGYRPALPGCKAAPWRFSRSQPRANSTWYMVGRPGRPLSSPSWQRAQRCCPAPAGHAMAAVLRRCRAGSGCGWSHGSGAP